MRILIAYFTQMDSLPSIHKKPFFAAEPSRAEWLIRSHYYTYTGTVGGLRKKLKLLESKAATHKPFLTLGKRHTSLEVLPL